MSRRVIGLGVSLGLLALGGCASTPRVNATTVAAIRSHLSAVYESVVRGDEAAYRRLVSVQRGDVYSDALTATMFESVRLHLAVEQRFTPSATQPTRVTAPAATTRRSPASLATVDYRENARAMMKAVQGWTFTVRGDRATIDELAGRPGAPTLRRVAGRWVLVPPPWDTPRDTATYRLAVESERRLADALSSARDAVVSGSARSVEDVNAILRARLTDPAPPATTEVRE